MRQYSNTPIAPPHLVHQWHLATRPSPGTPDKGPLVIHYVIVPDKQIPLVVHYVTLEHHELRNGQCRTQGLLPE